MPSLKFTETYLSSSVIIVPTVNLENFQKTFSDYWNFPDFHDQTLAIDPPDENGHRKFPHLSFVNIEQTHDGSLYPHDENNESLDLTEALISIIEKGTEFKLQYIQLEGAGIYYTSFHCNSDGILNQYIDAPVSIDKKFRSNNIDS